MQHGQVRHGLAWHILVEPFRPHPYSHVEDTEQLHDVNQIRGLGSVLGPYEFSRLYDTNQTCMLCLWDSRCFPLHCAYIGIEVIR